MVPRPLKVVPGTVHYASLPSPSPHRSFPWLFPNSLHSVQTEPAPSISPGRPGRPPTSPALRKPRHTGAVRTEHPRGRDARVTAGGPPGPYPSRSRGRGDTASQRGTASRRPFIPVAERLLESTPRPTPTLPHPGRRARAGAKGPWPRRSALSPPLVCSSRLVPGGHASPTPAGRRAGAKLAPFIAGRKVLGPEWRGEPGSAASCRVRAPSSPPSRAGDGFSPFGKREGAGLALL